MLEYCESDLKKLIKSSLTLELIHIQNVLGCFARGDLIELCSKEYGPIGRSLIAYGDEELTHALSHGNDQSMSPESMLGDNFDGPVCMPRDWALTYAH